MWNRVEDGVVEAFREAKAPDLRSLPIDSLAKLADSAIEQRTELGSHILKEGEAQKSTAQSGDWAAFEAHREIVKRLQEEWQDLNEQIGDLEELLRRKRFDARVVERLGSRGRAVALDAGIMVLIAAVLGMLVWEWDAGETAPAKVVAVLVWVDTAICALFLWEFFWKMSLAESKWWFFKRHWIDFVSSLPVSLIGWGLVRWGRAARILRVARAARMLRFMRVLRALRGVAFVFRGFDKITKSFNVRVLNRPLAATLVFLILGGVAMGMIEGKELVPDIGLAETADGDGPGEGLVPADAADGDDLVEGLASGDSSEKALKAKKDEIALARLARGLWWSFATVCTGGFADIHDPATKLGQLLTVLLVILGAILTGAFTAALASVLMGDDTERIERKLAAVMERLDDQGGG